MTSPELVLTVPVESLQIQNCKPTGLIPFDLERMPQYAYALEDRAFLDNKSDEAIAHGLDNPQILAYLQLVNPQGLYFAYQRKGKEEGLFGNWSIGVGGHIDQIDVKECSSKTLSYIVVRGAIREIVEEMGINAYDINIEPSDFRSLLYSHADKTSMVHVGLPLEMLIADPSKLNPHPDEFCNYTWLTQSQLKSGDREWETWSKLLIEDMQ